MNMDPNGLKELLQLFFAQEGALPVTNRVLDRLLTHLAPTGYFFLGHAETLDSSVEQMRCLRPSIYARRYR